MRYFSVVLFLTLTLTLTLSVPVEAHDIIMDKDTSVFVHIDPSHEPVVGQASHIYLSIGNKAKTFSIEKCSCMLKISHEGKDIIDTRLVESNNTESFGIEGVPITFEHEGIYHLNVEGDPLEKGMFDSFSVSYDIRVTANSSTASHTSEHDHQKHSPLAHMAHFILVGAGIVSYGTLAYLEKRKKRKTLKD